MYNCYAQDHVDYESLKPQQKADWHEIWRLIHKIDRSTSPTEMKKLLERAETIWCGSFPSQAMAPGLWFGGRHYNKRLKKLAEDGITKTIGDCVINISGSGNNVNITVNNKSKKSRRK